MSCLSCAERAEALKKAGRALREGEIVDAIEPLKFVAQSGVRDIRSSLAQAAAAAHSRLSGGRR